MLGFSKSQRQCLYQLKAKDVNEQFLVVFFVWFLGFLGFWVVFVFGFGAVFFFEALLKVAGFSASCNSYFVLGFCFCFCFFHWGRQHFVSNDQPNVRNS